MKVGLMLPLGEDDGLGRALSWPELRTLAVTAETAGLDSIWAPDHLVFQDKDRLKGIHECWTILSAVAAVTERITVGPLVLAVPFRNPALTAKMAAELDGVSNGRLVLGLGCGWHQPEFDDFDYPFDHRVGRFEEALQIIMPMLREGRARFSGRWHRADAAVMPPGPRASGPRVLIAGKNPRMMRLVAHHADAWNAAWYGDPADLAELDERVARLGEACEAEGRDPSTIERTAGVFVSFRYLLQPGGETPPATAMQGRPDEVGAMLAAYPDHGIDHLIVHLWPRRPEAVEELGRSAAIARSSAEPAAAVHQ
jgi:probable F420-dependent oxidoreductase